MSLDCSICLQKMRKDLIVSECGHLFHEYCMDSWTNILLRRKKSASCPICKLEDIEYTKVFLDLGVVFEELEQEILVYQQWTQKQQNSINTQQIRNEEMKKTNMRLKEKMQEMSETNMKLKETVKEMKKEKKCVCNQASPTKAKVDGISLKQPPTKKRRGNNILHATANESGLRTKMSNLTMRIRKENVEKIMETRKTKTQIVTDEISKYWKSGKDEMKMVTLYLLVSRKVFKIYKKSIQT
eukprot:UN11738